MRTTVIVAWLACCVPVLSAHAQPAEICAAILARLGPGLRPASPPRVVTKVGDDACRYEGIHLTTNSRAGWDIASVLVRGLQLEPAGAQDVRVEARGASFALNSGNAGVDWMNRQQQIPFDVTLDYTYDPATKRAVLRELSLQGETGRVALDGVIEDLDGLDLLRLSTSPPPVNARIRALHLNLDSKRFILSFVLPMVIQGLPASDPGGEVERVKALVVKTVRELLPDAPPAAMDAITGFVQDFPKPRHPFTLSLEATGPAFGAADAALAAGPRDTLVERLRHLRVGASYTGELR